MSDFTSNLKLELPRLPQTPRLTPVQVMKMQITQGKEIASTFGKRRGKEPWERVKNQESRIKTEKGGGRRKNKKRHVISIRREAERNLKR